MHFRWTIYAKSADEKDISVGWYAFPYGEGDTRDQFGEANSPVWEFRTVIQGHPEVQKKFEDDLKAWKERAGGVTP